MFNVTFDSRNVKPAANAFANGLVSRRLPVPASDMPMVALMTFERTAADEPSAADSLAWYSDNEATYLENEAGCFEAAVGLDNGYFFG